ncbi:MULTISPECIES: site-specific DNA-methyltransferase [Corynebacterium]|uniref:site-specific DNA-methyltransferase n=1 Tax=Corynebacterium TaxID=1716 RepID=UPI00054E96B1|nr:MULTISPECIES: site-specific DNA-methyltransferase [Corynebacterium]OBA54597.1 DNA methyltransferase [Corynebacterium sp. EPI-003-04-2554_SCH2473622]
MIRHTSEHNETVKPNDYEIERIRSLLPEYFDGDGNFKIDRLQQAFQDGDVDLTREGYELNFLGKSYAKYLTSTKTETVVVPDLGHNSKPINADSENLYIVGDNLDALKHLIGSYAGKVKCIYIDPPYNTGSDGFVYNDDFSFTAPQLVEKVGLTEDEAERVLDLRGKSSHSAWLTFMYPRLQLAKELLADDGVIFISIDDNEQANLRLLCDEVFGEQNFVAGFVVVRSEGGGLAKQAVIGHDYLPAYCKNVDAFVPLGRPKDIRGQVISKGGEDYWVETDWLRKEFGKYGTCPYEEIAEILGEQKLHEVNQELESGNYVLVPKGGYHLVGRLRKISEDTSKFYTVLKKFDGDGYAKYLNKLGVNDLDRLNLAADFSFPKPVELVRQAIEGATIRTKSEQDIVLDFFSGSATTAEALMRQNAKDSGNRRWILVQLPEVLEPTAHAYKTGFRKIDEIGRERVARAAAKIKKETGADIDYGFKLYRLNEPSGGVLDDLLTFDPEQDDTLLAADYVSKFDLNGTPGHDTVLATWLVEDGHGLTTHTQKVALAGYKLDVCGDSAYIISPGLTSDDVVELVRLLENGDLAVSRVVVFGYSVTFGVMHELKKNLSVLKSGRTVSVIERL